MYLIYSNFIKIGAYHPVYKQEFILSSSSFPSTHEYPTGFISKMYRIIVWSLCKFSKSYPMGRNIPKPSFSFSNAKKVGNLTISKVISDLTVGWISELS